MANQQDQILIPRHTFERQLFSWLAEQDYQVLQFRQSSPDGLRQTLGFHFQPGSSVEPSGKSCLLAHGTGFDALFPMVEIIRNLAKEGHEIFTFDLPGHGFYSRGFLDSSSALTCMDSLLSAVQARSKFGAEKLVGIGHSLGGVLLADAACRHTRIIKKLILVGTPSRLRNTSRFLGETRFIFQKSFWDELDSYPILELLPSAGPFRRGAYPIRVQGSEHSFGYIKVVRQIISELYLRALTHSPVETPCLWIGSDADLIAPLEQINDYAKIFPRLESQIIKGLYHYNLLLAKETARIVAQASV